MKTKQYIVLFILAVNIFSCREPIDIDVPDTQKKIVLNGFINPDSIITVNLSESIGILEKDDDIKFLNNALVKIYENDVFKETLQYDTNGYYRGTVYPQIGKTYKITAENPPLDAVYAETEILPIPEISNITSEPEFDITTQTWYNQETGEPFDTTFYKLSSIKIDVTLKDPPNISNYYLLTFSANLAQYGYYPPDYNPVFIGYKMTSLDYNAINLNWENYYFSNDLVGYVINDNLFDGNNFTVNADIWIGSGGYNGYSEGDNTLDKIYVNLLSITEDFYRYVISYSKYEDIEGNPLAEPVNIFSDIHNGFGLFTGYSTKKDSVLIVYPDDK